MVFAAELEERVHPGDALVEDEALLALFHFLFHHGAAGADVVEPVYQPLQMAQSEFEGELECFVFFFGGGSVADRAEVGDDVGEGGDMRVEQFHPVVVAVDAVDQLLIQVVVQVVGDDPYCRADRPIPCRRCLSVPCSRPGGGRTF